MTVYRIVVNTRWSKGERKTKEHLEKDCQVREKQGGVEDLGCGQSDGIEQRMLVRECDGLMHLLARRESMMMMISLFYAL